MQLGLRGKTAIVAAASRGSQKQWRTPSRWRALTWSCFRATAAIEAAGQEVRSVAVNGSQVVGLTADVTTLSDVEHVVNETIDLLGGAEIVFNNARGPKPGVFDNLTDDDWRTAVDLNLMSKSGSRACACRACAPDVGVA
jgi:3-oxoacyl-[acyl-carrier protein] reductase